MVDIMCSHDRLVDHGGRLVKQDGRLVIDHRRPVHHNGRLVIDDWTTMDHERRAMHHDVRTMIYFGWRMVNYWRSFDQNCILFGCFTFFCSGNMAFFRSILP